MSSTIGGVRIVDMPDLGAVNDTSSVVGERAGSGRFGASALRSYTMTGSVVATRGSTSRTLQDRFADVIHVEDFGAVANASTDDAAAINAALASAMPGQEVWLASRGRHYCATDITIPVGITLRAGWTIPGNPTTGNNPIDLTKLNGALILNSAATINMNDCSGIKGVPIYRSGLAPPVVNTAAYAGTAITQIGYTDVYVGYCLIMGFAQGFIANNCARQHIEWCYWDNNSGISITDSHDTPRISNNHMWPFASISSTAVPANHYRTGTAYYVAHSDLPTLHHNFCIAYNVGYLLSSSGGAHLHDCQADGLYSGAVGFKLIVGSNGVSLTSCVAFGESGSTSTGYWVELPDQDFCELLACCSTQTQTAIHIVGGDVRIMGGYVETVATGVDVLSPNSFVTIGAGWRAESIGTTTVNNAGASGGVYLDPGCDFSRVYLGTAGNISTTIRQFSITAASPMSIPAVHTVFNIVGTTSFSAITGGWAGRQITLIFSGVLTLTHGGAANGMFLSGLANVTTYSGMAIQLVHNGTLWFEVGRIGASLTALEARIAALEAR